MLGYDRAVSHSVRLSGCGRASICSIMLNVKLPYPLYTDALRHSDALGLTDALPAHHTFMTTASFCSIIVPRAAYKIGGLTSEN